MTTATPFDGHPLREHLTDLDCLDETLAFNRAFERAAATRPARRGPLDPDTLARLRRNRLGGDTPPHRLPQARDRRLPGGVPVRVLDPGAPEGVLLHLHGGGWAFGSADGQDERLWELARRARLAVVSVDYRLAPEHPHPAGPDDCEAAARWLAAHAEAEFGTRRLLIAGESAGAHLAVLTLLRLRDDLPGAYRAAHLAFGPYDLAMTPSQRDFGDRLLLSNTRSLQGSYEMYSPGTGPGLRRDPALSPLYADLTGLPPARLVVGTEDPLLDDSVLLARRWRAAGGTARLDVVAGAMHGFTLYPLTVTTRERRRESDFLTAAGR
ncbi:alpha/beta hydrolase fold domain-containing protein [Kitasatospora sp. NA04385]|uniref:alpha/beta hydrolase n=1 Tax=Kitasatospora sp. NA04385 TaxID=2742135 RepID=UPI0015914CE9|nr:alpha/beta hydrolase fold domain-containing protein [Kitasatospora sp. NA04385]QKW22865.1 alpha/beta hydrolase fold domain-containing protein [Kitasatospora sp. NA04385]